MGVLSSICVVPFRYWAGLTMKFEGS